MYYVDMPSNYDMNKPCRLFYTSHWIGSKWQDVEGQDLIHCYRKSRRQRPHDSERHPDFERLVRLVRLLRLCGSRSGASDAGLHLRRRAHERRRKSELDSSRVVELLQAVLVAAFCWRLARASGDSRNSKHFVHAELASILQRAVVVWPSTPRTPVNHARIMQGRSG